MSGRIPVAVLGGSGYVAGELLRLLTAHPRFEPVSAVSTTQAGEPVTGAFPHLAGTRFDGVSFDALEDLATQAAGRGPLGVFAATPHGATAGLLDETLSLLESAGVEAHVVDLSADFRFRDAARYRGVYGTPHGAPGRLPAFTCALPDLRPGRPPGHVSHPGCFTTAAVLAAAPFLAGDLVEPEVFVSAVTGSSGSGRTPAPGTHHPDRHGSLWAYAPLGHRHEAEMQDLLGQARGGEAPSVDFVPHSGPFVRGIHATLRMKLRAPVGAEALVERVDGHYAGSAFVAASLRPPRLSEVVGTNRCRIGVAVRGETLVVTSVIDNLVKGAAGGGVQWMNRLFDLPDDTGLRLAGLGWV